MKKLLLLLSIVSVTQSNAQQNLVLNPSFEDVSGNLQCSYYGGTTFPITYWDNANDGTIDAFSNFVLPSCVMYTLNTFSGQVPRTGNNYLGFYTTNNENFNTREYVRGQLSEPLLIGSTYNIEFYVCLGQYSDVGMNNIGLVFINNTTPLFETIFEIPIQPHVNYSGSPITDKNNWTLMSFQYTPTTPNLDAFIIGNFFSTQDTDFEVVAPNFINQSYFLIDDVLVNRINPAFNIPLEICQGDFLELPDISIDGITGTWSSPANNQETTTYIFTPQGSDLLPFVITVVVKPRLVPEFDEFGPFCGQMPEFTDLPTISNNGVEGTWNPTFIPTQTETYTFTPNDTQCNESITKTIVIETIPIFDEFGPFCEPDLNFSLPTISTNGISGSWSPEFDPYNSKTYTFTRDSGDCTLDVSLDIFVSENFEFDLIHYCKDSQYYVEVKFRNIINQSNFQYVWKINGSEIVNNESKLVLSKFSDLLQEINVIEVQVNDINGCYEENKVEVLGKYFCVIQKGISPNGDGLNEYLDLVSFGGVDLKIFNRYGSVVYEKSNYRNEWKGQSNSGKDLPSGTYFYQIQTKIGEEFTGYIQLTY